MSSIYEINKGINKPLEFRGLKAQYIAYLATGLVGLLILFVIAYMAGVPVYLCLFVVVGLGFVLFSLVYKLSHKYGEHGLMKHAAFRQVPPAIICRTRKIFLDLSADKNAATQKTKDVAAKQTSDSADRI